MQNISGTHAPHPLARRNFNFTIQMETNARQHKHTHSDTIPSRTLQSIVVLHLENCIMWEQNYMQASVEAAVAAASATIALNK